MIEMIEPTTDAQVVDMPPTSRGQVATNQQTTALATATPAALLQMAVAQGADLDRLERLMALQERWEANEARKAYTAAMAEFKRNAPTITKDKHVAFQTQKGTTEYDHATLGNVVKQVVAGLSAHGFSHAWNPKRAEGRVHVTCTLTHRLGHSESITLDAAPDESGGKNSIQALGSAISYLQRYTLLAITGLATEDATDDDGAGTEGVDQMLLDFQDAALLGIAALRKMYDDAAPPEEWWGKHSKSLKAAAKVADEGVRK